MIKILSGEETRISTDNVYSIERISDLRYSRRRFVINLGNDFTIYDKKGLYRNNRI